MQGRAEDYYRDGKLRVRTMMQNGMLQGRYESYFPDGVHESLCNYVHDSLDGSLFAWTQQHFTELVEQERFRVRDARHARERDLSHRRFASRIEQEPQFDFGWTDENRNRIAVLTPAII